MKKRLTVMLGVLALALGWAVPARADDTSGPDHVTLVSKSWGAIYYQEGLAEHYDIQENMLGWYSFLRHGLPVITVSRDGDGWYVSYPDKSWLSVRPEDGKVKVVFHGKKSKVARDTDGFVVTIPGDVITYRRRGGEVTIRGKDGIVRETESAEGFVITSPAGTTRYLRGAGGGFHLSGIPINQHPYVRRGLFFQAHGVGVFVDFHMPKLGRAFSILDWEPEMRVR